MKRAIVSLLLLAACTDGNLPSDHVDTVDTDTDTTGREDTFVLNPGDTDTTVETDPDTGFLDSDSGLAPDDTAACKLGYFEDCDGRCFPDHFVGDGFCDDGGLLPANFDCDAWNHDHGDCVSGDTDDTDAVADCGRLTLEFHPTYYPNEIGWYIDRIDSGVVTQHEVYKSNFGAYTSAKTYVHDLFLEPGHYQFVGQDSYGDGWHGGWFVVVDEVTGQAVVSGGPEMAGYSSGHVWEFDVRCDTPKCTVDLTTLAGADPAEDGWQLYTSASRSVAHQLPGTIGAGTTTTPLDLYQGSYVVRLRDVGGDGWEGGLLEARYRAGLLLNAHGIGKGTDDLAELYVDCGEAANQPAVDAPPGTVTPSSCTGAKISYFQRGDDYDDVGWELWSVADWSRVAARATGSYTITSNFVDTVNLQTGRYFFRALDGDHDGWEDARLSLDGPDGTMLQTFVMPFGSNAGFYVDVLCPADGGGDTDVHTDVPPHDCEPGAVRDCRGVCFPEILEGDRLCDDGTLWSADFACAEHRWDGGDCPAPQD